MDSMSSCTRIAAILQLIFLKEFFDFSIVDAMEVGAVREERARKVLRNMHEFVDESFHFFTFVLFIKPLPVYFDYVMRFKAGNFLKKS